MKPAVYEYWDSGRESKSTLLLSLIQDAVLSTDGERVRVFISLVRVMDRTGRGDGKSRCRRGVRRAGGTLVEKNVFDGIELSGWLSDGMRWSAMMARKVL